MTLEQSLSLRVRHHRHKSDSSLPSRPSLIGYSVTPFEPLLETLLSLQGQPAHLFMSATLAEEYSDNFSQSGEQGDGRDEFRTLLSIGTVYRLDNGQSFVSLANSLSADYQANSGDSDIGFVNLSLTAGHQISRLSLH